MVDLRIDFKDIVTDLGNATIVLENRTLGTYNNYGDVDTSTGTITLKGVPIVFTEESQLVKEGVFLSGDITFYFDYSAGTNVQIGDRLMYLSKYYKVKNVIPHEISANIVAYEVRTSVKG